MSTDPPTPLGRTDEKLAHELLEAYLAAGGNFIDTAEMYPVPPAPEYVGATEKLLGRWIAAHPEQRKKVCRWAFMAHCGILVIGFLVVASDR